VQVVQRDEKAHGYRRGPFHPRNKRNVRENCDTREAARSMESSCKQA
jgi:hypothetical protein